MEMDTSEIQAAIDSIPAKKEGLRKAFEVLQSYSSSFSSFTLKWNDLDGHVSFIEKSIEERFRELEAKVRSCVADKPAAAAMVAAERKVVEKEPEIKVENKVVEKEPEVKSVLELKDFCVRMDGKGLRSYILKNRKLLPEFRDELRLALRAAPNPIMLVLDSLDGFVPSRKVKKKELELIWKTCVHLVQVLHELALEIKASYRERARRFATEWRGKITDGEGNNWFVVLGFLHLVVTFGLVDSFAANDILDVLVLVARRRQIVDMCRSLGFEDKMHDFIDKLKKKGKEVDAVKFVLAFNLSEKHPPASLLESYVNTIKKAAFEQRQKAKSTQIKNFATKKEIDALKRVMATVKEFNLESVYSCEHLHKRIEQLEDHHAEWKKIAKLNVESHNENYEPANKRPRRSDSSTVVASPPDPLHHQSHISQIDRSPYHALPHHYSLAAAASHSAISANLIGLNVLQAPRESYASPSNPSQSGATYHNRQGTYGGYSSLTRHNPSFSP